MNKLVKKVKEIAGEYFLGTESKKSYEQEVTFLEEFLEGKDLQDMSYRIRNIEKTYFWLGKMVPNALDVVALFTNPIYLILGEIMRASHWHHNKSVKKDINQQRRDYISSAQTKEVVDEVGRSIDRLIEGDEWKTNC